MTIFFELKFFSVDETDVIDDLFADVYLDGGRCEQRYDG